MRKNNNLLRSARKDRKWTTEFISKQVGVSRITYMRWETGRQIPRHASLDALCRVFSLSAEELGFAKLAVLSTSQQQIVQTQAVDASRQASSHIQQPSGDKKYKVEEKQTFDTASEELAQTTQIQPFFSVDTWIENIASCWKDYMLGQQTELEQVLSTYITQLNRPTLTPGPEQHLAASFMSQTCQLTAMLQLQHSDIVGACQNGTQAVVFGQLARNWNVYVAAQMRLASIFSACKRPGAALEAYNDALHIINTYSDAISPTLHSRIFAGLAEIQATMGREQEARQLLKLACAVFPAYPENDQCFFYTYYDRSMLYLYEGIVFLRLGLTKHAWDAFSQVDTLTPTPKKRTRAEFLKYRAYTSLLLGNMTQCCIYLEAATRAAREISSDFVFGEVYAIYEHVLAVWGQEPRVRLLAKLFQM